jgi:murein hydrolase activator
MEFRLAQVKEQRQQTKKQIDMLTQGVEGTRKEFFARLTALYRMGRMSSGSLLFNSQSYLDLLRMDKYLRVIIDSDARIVETYRRQVALKERYEETLSRDQIQGQRAISDVEKKREEVRKVREEKRTLLKSIQSQKVVYQKLIGELEARAKDFQSLIDKLEKEKGLMAYGKSKPDSPKGKLIAPLQGRVVSQFKEKGQNGIEIKAPMGTEIRAVLAGRVLYSDWFKGFGNVVIIDHGDHVFTVSGYSSQLLKKAGDNVSQGEPIALVGSEGSLKGPCLYFEIRLQGKPQDPMEWIPNLDKLISLQEDGGQGKKREGAHYVLLEKR